MSLAESSVTLNSLDVARLGPTITLIPGQLPLFVRICRELRSILADPRLHGRPVVYSTYANPAHKTNTAFALASYLILVTACTPEEA